MMNNLKILITGAGGIIGVELCRKFVAESKVIALDINRKPDDLTHNIVWEQTDIANFNAVKGICHRYIPDVVIHCAGIAHQKVGAVSAEDYMYINSEATENLAKVAATSNPDVRFIFLSTVSVYGEENLSMPVSENSAYNPSSDYAVSKCDAEKRLLELSEGGILNNLIILRLAPVYDRDWGLNLERRVFAPKKMAYLLFGSGEQRMSALARNNLVDFVHYLLERSDNTDNFLKDVGIFNVCDEKPYTFTQIIQVFKESEVYFSRPSIHIPHAFIWLATRLLGMIFSDKKNWWHACYDKLASDLVFDNTRMLQSGFYPQYSLETVFCNEIETVK